MFGVCGNELSADGHIVDKRYGCGAHSDTPAPAGTGSPAYEPYDDGKLDVSETPTEVPTAAPTESLEPEQPERQAGSSETQTETQSETAEAQAETMESQPESQSGQPQSAAETETSD